MLDQRACRRIGRIGQRAIFRERRDDRLRERLAELDAPLVECVDPGKNALDERAMLVEREQGAEIVCIEFRQQERRRRAIPRTFARGDRRLQRRATEALMRKLAT